MPLTFICKGCGAELYTARELIAPEDVVRMVGSTCSRCGRRLDPNPDPARDVVIKPIE